MQIEIRVYPSRFDLLWAIAETLTDNWIAVACLAELVIGTLILTVLTGWGYNLGIAMNWYLLGVVREPRPDEVWGLSLAVSSLASALDYRRMRWAWAA